MTTNLKGLFLLVVCFLSFGITSCGKDKDTTKPTIAIVTPERDKDTIQMTSDSLNIRFKITDNAKMSSYSYVIKDTGNVKYSEGGMFNSSNDINFARYVHFWGLSSIKEFKIIVQGYDEAYNKEEVSRTFYLRP